MRRILQTPHISHSEQMAFKLYEQNIMFKENQCMAVVQKERMPHFDHFVSFEKKYYFITYFQNHYSKFQKFYSNILLSQILL